MAGDFWLAGWRPYALLVGLCLCLYLPGLAAIPVTDRDEARFAQATRQMLETGDFLHIRFQDEARNNKPAGIYWLQSAAVAALSTPRSSAIWPYRVPSLFGATFAALLTFAFGRTLLGEPWQALAAAALLAAALGTVAEAHLAKTDATLLAAIAAGQGALGLTYVCARAGTRVGLGVAVCFWLAEIAAIYLKGPIGPGLAVVTAATLSVADRDGRWLRSLRPLAGIAVTVLSVAPWLYAIEHATEGQFLEQSVGRDFFSKVFGVQEAHGAPPLYYLGLAFLTFWPGSLLLAPAVIHGWRNRAQPAIRFLLAWLVPGWIALELVPTKLPHYALPLYPALALLAAHVLGERINGSRWVRGALALNKGLWALASLGIAVGLIILPIRFCNGATVLAVVTAIFIAALTVAVLYRQRGPRGTMVLLLALAVVLVVPAASRIVPHLDALWLSRGAAAMVARHPPPAGTMLAVVGYNEPSLVFLLDNNFKAQTADVPVPAGSEALVNSRETPVFMQTLTAQGLAARPIDSVAGTDYSNGQQMTLTLYRIEAK